MRGYSSIPLGIALPSLEVHLVLETVRDFVQNTRVVDFRTATRKIQEVFPERGTNRADSALQLVPEKWMHLGSRPVSLVIRFFHDRTQALQLRSYKAPQCRISGNILPRLWRFSASVC